MSMARQITARELMRRLALTLVPPILILGLLLPGVIAVALARGALRVAVDALLLFRSPFVPVATGALARGAALLDEIGHIKVLSAQAGVSRHGR
jgi:hypothetical protein